jgi:hypothetical protein
VARVLGGRLTRHDVRPGRHVHGEAAGCVGERLEPEVGSREEITALEDTDRARDRHERVDAGHHQMTVDPPIGTTFSARAL